MEDFLDDFVVDDVVNEKKRKKGINSPRKGKTTERQLCKILSNRFGKEFTRSVGSGNRWGQISQMPDHAKETFSGDICPPKDFLWVIECKGGYENDIDLNGFHKGIKRLNEFMQQSLDDAARSGRKPLLVWKRSRKPWLACFRESDLSFKFSNYMIYDYQGLWNIVLLDELLKAKDKVFFK